MPSAVDPAAQAQVEAVVRALEARLGSDLVSACLHGSAARGGLRPDSDVDVLAIVAYRLAAGTRRNIVADLMPISGRRALAGPARPLELVVVVVPDVRPWRYPPTCELLYGEWERDAYEQGYVPRRATSPDLAITLLAAREWGLPIRGPAARELLDPVPVSDLRAASVAGIDGLLADLQHDTRNVILTLARVWLTVETGTIASKDQAADWAMARLDPPQREVLALARDGYRGDVTDEWAGREQQVDRLVRVIVTAVDTAGGSPGR